MIIYVWLIYSLFVADHASYSSNVHPIMLYIAYSYTSDHDVAFIKHICVCTYMRVRVCNYYHIQLLVAIHRLYSYTN